MAPPSRFRRGAAAFTKDGKRYIVDDVDDGIVYCSSPGGAETEFPEARLMNEVEWTSRSGGRPQMIQGRIRQSPRYAPYAGRLDRAGAEMVLDKAERLYPGLLDFVAVTTAARILAETGDQDFIAELSVQKCREPFDAAQPQTRLTLLADIATSAPDRMISAASLGDNLMRAMIEKGLDVAAYEKFLGSRRR